MRGRKRVGPPAGDARKGNQGPSTSGEREGERGAEAPNEKKEAKKKKRREPERGGTARGK